MSICEEKDVTLYQNQISITMEPSIYSFSLYTALPLMLFFGFYFLLAKTPEKKIFKNYLRSRQIMGIAMLLLSANYSVHAFIVHGFIGCPVCAQSSPAVRRRNSARQYGATGRSWQARRSPACSAAMPLHGKPPRRSA